MIRSLLWKEWHEQGWRIAFGCVLLGCVAGLGLNARLIGDEPITVMTMLVGAFLLPIVAAMGMVAPERQERTLGTLMALPVKGWVVLAVKTAFGLAGCLLPLVVAMIVSLLMTGGREVSSSRILLIYGIGAIFGAAVVVWTLTFGARQSTEARVGLVGMAVIAGWALLVILGDEVWQRDPAWRWLDRLAMTISPFGVLDEGLDGRRLNPRNVLAQLLMAVPLFLWAVRRYRQPGRERP